MSPKFKFGNKAEKLVDSSGITLPLVVCIQEIFSSTTPEDTLQITVKNIHALLKPITASIALKEGEHFRLVAIEHQGSESSELRQYVNVLVPDFQISKVVARENRSAVWVMGPEAPRSDFFTFPYYLGVPIRNESEEILGTIVLGFNKESEVNNQNIFIAEIIADVFFLAFRNSRNNVRLLSRGQVLEQERIAQQLHDSVAQNLFSASMKVNKLTENDSLGQEAKDDLGELVEMFSQIKTDLKTIINDSPEQRVQETNLEAIIELEFERHRKKSSIKVEKYLQAPNDLSSDLLETIRVVVCEALTNIRKHSHAQAASITFSTRNDLAYLTIQDDGVGMADTPRETSEEGFHFGLTNLRRLVTEMGGTFDIELVEDDHGTSINVRLPLKRAEGRL
jgi:signal transduction histidine kinase